MNWLGLKGLHLRKRPVEATHSQLANDKQYLTLSEIAAKYNISRQRVWQIVQRAEELDVIELEPPEISIGYWFKHHPDKGCRYSKRCTECPLVDCRRP